jgi:multidrug efflux pump subunit AcrA (membrane-fusion protein)
VSLADAQVKQALGVLESARAALNKTAIKTPVAGTVTAVSISVGDIINIGSDVVFVASDAPMEMETGDTVTVPLTAVKFTPSKAYIFTVHEGKLVAHEVETGSVTTKSIAISGAEGITDIVLDVRGLKDGDAVVVQ